MKKAVYLFLLVLITGSLLSGCNKKSTPSANDVPPPASVPGLEQALKLPDEELLDRYCSGIDLCLGDDLLFAYAKDIPSETLFTFFCYMTSNQYVYERNYQDKKWYSKTDDKYHVPVADIEEVLNRYFDGHNFDPAQIDGYQPQAQEIVAGGLSGFGGGRFPKLVAKEQLNSDTLKLTVDYCDPEYENVFYTKAYTLRFTAEGYQYLSIKKVV